MLRDGGDAVLIAYGPVMLHEALLAAEELAESGELSVRVVAMPWLNRFDTEWLAAEVAPFDHVFVLEDHAPVGGLGDGLRAALPGRAVTVFGVEGWPACGTPDEALRFHGLDGASLAARIGGARRPPSRQSQLARRSMTKRTWVVLPDQLSIRVFFDTGIVERAPRAPRRAPRSRLPRTARGGGGMGRPACRGFRCWRATRSRRRPGSPIVPSRASTRRSTVGSATTRSRSG